MTNWCREDIYPGVKMMLEVNLDVYEGERILIMTDVIDSGHWREMSPDVLRDCLDRNLLARMVADIAGSLLRRPSIEFLPYPSVQRHGAELAPETAQRMKDSDVIIAITTCSLTHTQAAREACERGARLASMPLFLPEMFKGPMTADPYQMAEDSRRMAQFLTEGQTARLTCPLGTDLTIDLRGRAGSIETGLIGRGGNENLPAGEAYIAPLEGTAEGRVVVDGDGLPGIEGQMCIRFKQGEVCEIGGGGELGSRFCRLLELPVPGRQSGRRNFAELGIGTNPRAHSVNSILEAEKAKGTVHVAIGDNSCIGGKVSADLHQDFVLWHPDLRIDGDGIIGGGSWLI